MTGDVHTTDMSAGYALGALSPDERALVEAHMATCTQCREDVAEMSGVVSTLPLAPLSMTPPDALKGRILAAATAEIRAGASLQRRAVADAACVAGSSREPWFEQARQPAVWMPWLGAAAAVILGVTTLTTMRERDALQTQLNATNQQLVTANQDLVTARLEKRVATDASQQADVIVAALAAGTYRSMGTDMDTLGRPWRCTVVQPAGHNGMLVASIPEPPRGMAYQVWMRRGRTVHKAGMLMHGGMTTLTMPMPFERGDVVAFTVEQPVGVATPTMPYVMQVPVE